MRAQREVRTPRKEECVRSHTLRRSRMIHIDLDTGPMESSPPSMRVYADGREVYYVIGRMELAVPATTRTLRFACTPRREEGRGCPDSASGVLTVEVEAEGRLLDLEVRDLRSPTASARRHQASAACAVRLRDRCTLRLARNAKTELRVAIRLLPRNELRTEAPASSSAPSFAASVAGRP